MHLDMNLMTNIMMKAVYIIEMLLLISVLIIVHEAGHFFVARALGMRVDRVGLGLPFGPCLYEKKIGDITFNIYLLLFGAYVGFPDDDPESKIPLDDPDRLNNRPLWQRLAVVSAGVIANAVFAYLIVFFVAFASKSLPSGNYDVLIHSVQDKNVPAAVAGFEKGDKMVNVNGMKISAPMIFQEAAQRSKKFDGYVTEEKISLQMENIKSANKKLKLERDTKIPNGIQLIIPKAVPEEMITFENDYYLRERPIPAGVELTSEQKKLRDGFDKDNKYISKGEFTLYDIATASADTSHPLVVEVSRNGKLITLNPIYPNEEGLIGIYQMIEEKQTPIKSFKDVIVRSNEYIVRNTVTMIEGLGKLFTGKVAISNLHGVVAIIKIGGDTIERSFWDGLLLTALISIDLAIVNLLPVPVLDGGLIVINIMEKIRRKPFNKEKMERIAIVSFFLLISLMVLIMFNDIFALITKKF